MQLLKRISVIALLSGAIFAVLLFASVMPGVAAGTSPVPPGLRMPSHPAGDPPYIHIFVNQSHSWVQGESLPGTVVTLTLMRAGTQMDTQTVNTGGGNGFFAGFNGNTKMQANDIVEVMTSIGITASVDVIPMSGTSITSTISGHISAPVCPASIQAEVWASGFTTPIITATDASCNYHVDYTPFVVRKADSVVVWYVRPDSNRVGIVRSLIRADTDLDNDSVNGNTTPNASVTVNTKGVTFHNTADNNGNYGINLNGVDLTTGDILTVTAGTESVTIRAPMTLTVAADTATNIISGYGPTNTLMQIDLDNAGNYQFTTSPDTGYYSVTTDANPPGWNHDLQPQDRGQIGTLDENNERVFIHFGAVDLAMNMNSNGGGQASPGGRYTYELRPRSQQYPARNIVITDTLPVSASFVSLSGGYPYAQIGDQVVITMGLMHADEDQSLLLTVAFDPHMSPGDNTHNEATIGSTQVDANPGNNTASVDMQLQPNNTDLTLDMNPRTGDPLNGQQMIWEIGVYNKGNTGSGEVLLTDTLPVSTTFVRWWGQESGWTLVQSGTQVVWTNASLPGYANNRLYLVIALDPALTPDTQLNNEVAVYTSNDTNNGNDTASNNVHTGWPRRDVSVQKSYDGGATVADNTIMYGVNYNNDGNMTAHHVVVTDVLPPGTSLVQSGYGTPNGWVDVPFASHTGNTYVWSFGDMIPGAWGNMQLQVHIDAGDLPGTVLTNKAWISSDEGDIAPWNNTASVAQTVYPSGPNLRVWKEARWNGPGELQYTIHIENHGDVAIGAFAVTETYPLSTVNPNWNWQWQPGNINMNGDTSNEHYAVFSFDHLNSGDTIGVNVRVGLDGSLINQPGLHFVDLLTATVPPGDTYVADNFFTQVSGTGADLFATNKLAAGLVQPGEVMTFQVVYGNLSDQWQGSGQTTWLDFQLPDAFSFVSSNPPYYKKYGQYLVWSGDRVGNGQRNMVTVSARVPMSAKLGDSFISTASFFDLNTPSIEPDYANNTMTATVGWTITGRCYVPMVIK